MSPPTKFSHQAERGLPSYRKGRSTTFLSDTNNTGGEGAHTKIGSNVPNYRTSGFAQAQAFFLCPVQRRLKITRLRYHREQQVIAEYLVGRAADADPTLPSDAALAALQEAKKKPAKYKLAEVLATLVFNPDQANSWSAVRSLRSIAATVVGFDPI